MTSKENTNRVLILVFPEDFHNLRLTFKSVENPYCIVLNTENLNTPKPSMGTLSELALMSPFIDHDDWLNNMRLVEITRRVSQEVFINFSPPSATENLMDQMARDLELSRIKLIDIQSLELTVLETKISKTKTFPIKSKVNKNLLQKGKSIRQSLHKKARSNLINF